eukprot:6731765-Prymnesium_polylepis.1
MEECGLRRWRPHASSVADYELVTLPFPPRAHVPEFLERNPLGTVPWFEHQEPGDAAPRAAMSESCAIPMYLADLLGSPLGVGPAERDRGAYLNWLHHADATLTTPQAVTMRYALQEPGRADQAADDYARWFVARLRLLSAHLADGRQYLCGERFTCADICVGFALFNASADGLLGSGLRAAGREPLCTRYKPETRAYLERLMARPAWEAAQREQQEVG